MTLITVKRMVDDKKEEKAKEGEFVRAQHTDHDDEKPEYRPYFRSLYVPRIETPTQKEGRAENRSTVEENVVDIW